MAESFDNLLQRYDNNPLLAAAAMDVGTKVVDEAIQKAEQTGGDITDFLPRRTQEYMFALSKAALGAHEAMSRPARAAGGRTGYAFGSVAKGLVIPDDNASPADFDVAPTPSDDTLLAANYANTQNMGDPRASDWMEKNIATVKTPNDQKWSVHRQAAPDFQNFLEELHASGYAPVSSGGYNLRNIRGTNQLSQHAFGNAIDINAPANPQGGTKMDLPANVGELAAKHNLEWGGNWKNNPDPMHFEWKGPRDQKTPTGVSPTKPVQTATATGLAPKSDAGSLSDIGKTISDSVPTSSSFWVPLIAGLGTMLASDKYRFSQRFGEGLVGGAAAFGKQQEFGLKEKELQEKNLLQRFNLAKDLFKGPTLVNGVWKWEDVNTGQMIDQNEYMRRRASFIGNTPTTAAASTAPVTTSTPTGTQTQGAGLAPAVVEPNKPEPKQPTVIDNAVRVAKEREAAGATPSVSTAAVTPGSAPVTPPKNEPNPAIETSEQAQQTVLEMQNQARANKALWKNTPDHLSPLVLDPQIASLDNKITKLESAAELANERNPAQAQNFLAQAARLRTERDDKRATAEKSVGAATILQQKFAERLAGLQAELAVAPAQEKVKLEAEIAKLRATGPIITAEAINKLRGEKTVEFEFAPQVGPTGEKVRLPPGATMPQATASQPTIQQQEAPKVAEVDPKTAKLALARPIAPAGGGLVQPGNYPPGTKIEEGSDTFKNQAVLDGQFQKDFMEKAPSVGQARQRYMGLVNAFKLFESGSAESTLAGWGAIAQSFGYPEIARGLANGDPAAVQWTQKIGPNLVLETLKAATPRFAQSEFMTLQEKGTPEPNKLPQANFQMVKEGIATLDRTDAFMQAWQRASQEEGWRSPSAYYAAWSKANPIEKFEQSAERQMGNFAGMPLPPSSNWAPGAIYILPKTLTKEEQDAFIKRGLNAGDAFQYVGRDVPPEQRFVKIPKQQLYSIPAMRQ
jgi:hypothetical protein